MTAPTAAAILADLTRLVAVPSIGALPQHAADLKRSADLVAAMLREAGCPEVAVIAEGAAPAVIGRYPAPPGAPVVCLYAHHDVQPVGDPALWEHEPFSATQVGARVYGRGAADDKGGIALHLATLRELGPEPGVGLVIFIEGEEEIGSPNIVDCLTRYRDQLTADVYVIADAGNWDQGEPAFTVALRGVTMVTVELRTLDHAVHSGEYGGAVPDALTALIRLLATLHRADGAVAVAGLEPTTHFAVDYPEDRFRRESGLLEGVETIGQGSLADRLWSGPAITVIGLDATSVAEASNTLAPVARARISLRVPPGYDAADASAKLVAHLTANVPWGAQLTITPEQAAQPAQIPLTGPYAAAAVQAYTEVFGQAPVLMGQGGTIGLVNELRELWPESTVIVSAVCDPDSRMHSPNESVHLGDLVNSVQAQVRFLELLRP